jgi:glycosyltransferase involved in cell wall biosynthesis
MNILFIAQYFSPEIGALAARASELADHWSLEGHQVRVLTGFPNYPTGKVPEPYRRKIWKLVHQEQKDGYRVLRTWLTTFSNRTTWGRMAGYLSFFLSACLSGALFTRPEVMIGSSPPLTVGLAGWVISKLKGVPFVFEVRDLWPDSITASGVGDSGSLLIRTLQKMAVFLYRRCDHLVVVTPAFKEEIAQKWDIPPEKISVIPNGVDVQFLQDDLSRAEAKERLNLDGQFVVSYIGNYGWAQGLKTVIETADLMEESHPEVFFQFVGGGADEEKLKALCQQKALGNVRFVPKQPRERVPTYIKSSDICLVPLRDEPVFQTVIPSKMLEFMAGERPVLLGVRGQAQRIIAEAEAGISVVPQDPVAFREGIITLLEDPERRRAYGENGKQYIQEHYTRRQTALDYLSILETLS